jgi:hypothetical protein
MRGVCNCISDTSRVSRVCNDAAISWLQFTVYVRLLPVLKVVYFYISTYRSMCAVPNMAVFSSSLTSWFLCMLVRYFLGDFEIVPVAPIIAGISFVFVFLHKL